MCVVAPLYGTHWWPRPEATLGSAELKAAVAALDQTAVVLFVAEAHDSLLLADPTEILHKCVQSCLLFSPRLKPEVY